MRLWLHGVPLIPSSPEDDKMKKAIIDRLTIQAFELNLTLSAAGLMGIAVCADIFDRDLYPQLVVSATMTR